MPIPQFVPAWLLIVSVALAAICLLGLFSTEAGDTDFWWHLKTGQYILQRHALPLPDPFSYTTALHPAAYPGEDQVRHFNLTHEWLAEVLLYVAFSLGGIPTVILGRAAILAAFCGLAGLIAARRVGGTFSGLEVATGIAAAFAAASLAVNFTADRPAIVTFLFVAIFFFILEWRRGLWLLPPLALIWANAHGGFFLGWIVLLAYCVETLPIRTGRMMQENAPGDRKQLWAATAVSIAVSLLNPNGWNVIATLIRYRSSALQSGLVEWHRPYLWGPPYAFDVLLYALAAVLLMSWRKVRLTDWILFVAFAGAALTAFRNTLLIGLLSPVLIAAYFPWKFRASRLISWSVPTLVAIGLGAGVARGSFFQLRAADWKFPSGAADYLLANHIAGPIFNTYEYGGYLIWRLWPEQKVFIDGRSLSETGYRDYQHILYNTDTGADQMQGLRSGLLDHYGVQTVVMNSFEFYSGVTYPLALALGKAPSPQWELVYEDAQSLIFRKEVPAGTQVYQNKLDVVVAHFEEECEAHIDHAPDTPLCARTLADIWMRGGNKDKARSMLSLYLEHAPEKDPAAEQAMKQLSLP